jgi:hypothetical protein
MGVLYGHRHGGCEDERERRLRHCQGREVEEREGYEIRGRTGRRETFAIGAAFDALR